MGSGLFGGDGLAIKELMLDVHLERLLNGDVSPQDADLTITVLR